MGQGRTSEGIPFRVVIADGHPVTRVGLRLVIESARGLALVGEAATGAQAIALAARLSPDVLALDMDIRIPCAVETTREIRKARPDTEVLILSARRGPEPVQVALAAGARGYILKCEETGRIVEAIRAVARRKRCVTRKIDGIQPDPSQVLPDRLRSAIPIECLSGREREVLRHLAEGQSTKEIAATLSISPKTVEAHRGNVMNKLGLHSVAMLVRYAIRNSVIAP